jgi:hypothetical protein
LATTKDGHTGAAPLSGNAIPKNSPPPGKLRGLMADAGRVPESMDYYRRLIDFCAEWEINTLQFRLADDQGSALQFSSVPDIVTHKNAFTADELRDLAEYGVSHNVDVIPELESFGHTGFITRSPRYAHLLDSDANGDSEFSGICPVNPESLELFSKLYREVDAIFPSKYFHGGCDEVNWGGSVLSRQALQKKSRARIWADYLNALNQLSRSLGKEFIVWGDFVLHKQPDILGLLAKEVILMDWNYADTDARKLARTLQVVLDNGSRCIGAPALSCYRWEARVGDDQLRNVDAFSDAYVQNDHPHALGVMVTNWIPSRYLQNSIWDGFAYAAVVMKDGSKAAQADSFRRFVERHYQARWNDTWRKAFEMIYRAAPSFEGPAASSMIVPWSNEEHLSRILKRKPVRPTTFTTIRDLLSSLQPSVKKNHADFQSFQLCVEYLEAVVSRNGLVIEQASTHSTLDADALLIRKIAGRDHALAHALEADWNTGRPADSPAANELLFALQPKDQLLFQWKKAADYSAVLAARPEDFQRILRAPASA